MTGADVTELNTDLVRLGYASRAALGPRSGWDYFSGETAYALELLQAHLGLTQTGTLPLGQAVFLPGAVQVTGLGTGDGAGRRRRRRGHGADRQLADPGGDDRPGRRAADRGEDGRQGLRHPARRRHHARGDLLGRHRRHVLRRPRQRPRSAPGSGNGSDNGVGQPGVGPATITVLVSLTDPKAAGSLNQAPVTVTITTGSVEQRADRAGGRAAGPARRRVRGRR